MGKTLRTCRGDRKCSINVSYYCWWVSSSLSDSNQPPIHLSQNPLVPCAHSIQLRCHFFQEALPDAPTTTTTSSLLFSHHTAPSEHKALHGTPFYNWGILWLPCHTENSLRAGQSQFHICTSNLVALVWCSAHSSAQQVLGVTWAWRESGKSRTG